MPSLAQDAAGRTVICALRKTADTPPGAVVESRPQGTTPGGIAHFAPGGNGAATCGTRVHSSTAQSLLTSPASFAAPHTVVLTSLAATGTHVMRVNGVQVASESPAGEMAARPPGLPAAPDRIATIIGNDPQVAVLALGVRRATGTEV